MQKKWDIDVLGVLAEDEYVKEKMGKEAVFINQQGDVQFCIRIISQTPESFPNENLIWCYSRYLEEWGFEDNPILSRDEREQDLKNFLNRYFIIFGLNVFEHRKGQANYQASDVKIKAKFDDYTDKMLFQPIPIFCESSYNSSFDDFTNKLVTRRHIGKINRFSNEPSDTPTYILWLKNDGRYTILGEFEKHQYAYGGFQLYYEQLKQIEMPEEWIEHIIEVPKNEDILFIDFDSYNKFEELLKTSEPIKTFNSNSNLIKNNPNSSQEIAADKENHFIKHFHQITQDYELFYDKTDLINFHTAVKSSNLVILSGMSGTGKSKLVEMYGRAWGMNDEQLNIIPVRPSWTDDSDLIGYVDSVHMVYRPGDSQLINTLIHASKEENSNKLYLICFDEMNLARVEHYFSQFLSVLELEPSRRQLNLYNKELESRLYNSSKYKSSIILGDNILFVGTVNVDESTYHFSDKVLDRANVITLNPQMSFQNLDWSKPKNSHSEIKSYTANDFREFKNKPTTIGLSVEELKVLESIHQTLQTSNKQYGIGFRVIKQMALYLRNLPNTEELTRKVAFDLQLVQRVLTKLRGPEEILGTIIGTHSKETNEVVDSHLLTIFNQYPQVSDFLESKNVIASKAKEITINGYTS
jgi:hypothetical protein